MKPVLIQGGRVVDPGNRDEIADILIDKGKIAAVASAADGGLSPLSEGYPDLAVIDAKGKIVSPGLIDMHVHFREPGYEYKETIQSGCMAAAHGGFTAVCTMPNTSPVNDDKKNTEFVIQRAQQADGARVYPVAALSRGLKGCHLCDYDALKRAGAVAVTDDGLPLVDSRLMRQALESASRAGLPVLVHSEDLALAAGGAMNEGPTAVRLGLSGIPNAAESIGVMRDIALCELTHAPIHIMHVSTRESVRALRAAKDRGVPVTAETAPHYFTLTDDVVEKYGTRAKMNPPIRSSTDRQAVRDGLADGTIDVIATDHAPHSVIEKQAPFAKAPNGIVGLETSLSLSLKLVAAGLIGLNELISLMSVNPARILGLKSGISVGNRADITIIDTEKPYTVDAERFQSQGRNTPFDGLALTGRAVMTLVGGKIVFQD
jgi:dihydroorotase